jgi:hypothetical protein
LAAKIRCMIPVEQYCVGRYCIEHRSSHLWGCCGEVVIARIEHGSLEYEEVPTPDMSGWQGHGCLGFEEHEYQNEAEGSPCGRSASLVESRLGPAPSDELESRDG